MGRDDPRFLAVGHLSRAHGTAGQLLVHTLTDHPEGVYAPGVVLRQGHPHDADPDPDLPPLEVETARPYREGLLVSFVGIDDRTAAELCRGRYLFQEMERLAPLSEGELFHHQLVGMEVVTLDGAPVGPVVEVYEMTPADLLEVDRGERTVMIPFLEHIVVEVDADARRIVIDPPEGLLDL